MKQDSTIYYSTDCFTSKTIFDQDEQILELFKNDAQYINFGKLELLKVIGKGSFGIVYSGIYETSETIKVAVKTFKECGNSNCNHQEVMDSFMKEALIMKDFKNSNILGLIGLTLDTNNRPYIVTDFMHNGSLRSYLHRHKNKIRFKALIKFGRDIASGMQYLAENRIIHDDLAARSFLISI